MKMPSEQIFIRTDRWVPLGLNSPNHQCQDNCVIVLGDAHQGHIQQALQRYKVGSQANAIILNPSHPDHLKLAI